MTLVRRRTYDTDMTRFVTDGLAGPRRWAWALGRALSRACYDNGLVGASALFFWGIATVVWGVRRTGGLGRARLGLGGPEAGAGGAGPSGAAEGPRRRYRGLG